MQRQGNSHLTRKLFLLSALIALSLSFCSVSTYSLCLSAGKIHLIVWAELAASIALPLTARGYARLCRRFSNHVVHAGIFAVSAVVLFVSAATAPRVSVAALALPLLLFAKFHATFANLAFWNLVTAQRCDQESTRSPGLASAGFPLGWMGGGLIHLATGRLATTELQLFFSAIAVVLAAVVILTMRTADPGSSPNAHGHQMVRAPNQKVRRWNRERGPRMIYLLCAVSVIGSSFVGFLYNASTSACFSDRSAVARYLGLMDVVTGIVQFICASYFTDRVIRRFGAVAGMIALPLAMTCCVSLLLIGFHGTGTGSTLIWIASITRVGDIVLRKSLEKPSFATYCQRFSDERRQQVLRTFELVVKPMASTVAATLMTVVAINGSRNIEMSAWLCMSILVGWIFVAALVARQQVDLTCDTLNTQLAFARS